MSKTTRWGTRYGDIPPNSYQRISRFLTAAERSLLLAPKFQSATKFDAWWSGNDDNSIKNFVTTVDATEERFLSQEGLFEEVQNSKCINELAGYAAAVISLVEKIDVKDFSFHFLPSNAFHDVPLVYFEAAEFALREQNGVLNPNVVKILAADAWRQQQLTKLKA